MPPFLILSLPRSRSAWLSRFLTYGDHICGHEELRHFRTLGDVKLWFSQPNIGSAETAAAPWWRLLPEFVSDIRIVIVRRPVEEVFDSLTALEGVAFDPAALMTLLCRLDCKLDQIKARVPNVLSVSFDDLNDEATCAAVFEHCLPHKHDHGHWARLAPLNVQASMPALIRYTQAYAPVIEKMAAMAKRKILSGMATRAPVEPAGMTFQTEPFDQWERDARLLIEDHHVLVNESPAEWRGKNIPLMRQLYDLDMLQITTARSNGRIFGYVMTLIGPSFVSDKIKTATNATFYASPDTPGIGLKLQRAALKTLKERGVNEVFFEVGSRGSGPRISMLYKRLGAQEHGTAYRLQLAEV